jgi:hypothetical protein
LVVVFFPGAFIGYRVALYIDSYIHFSGGAQFGKLMAILLPTIAACVALAPIWTWIMKKLKITETEEFKFMTKNPWRP